MCLSMPERVAHGTAGRVIEPEPRGQSEMLLLLLLMDENKDKYEKSRASFGGKGTCYQAE